MMITAKKATAKVFDRMVDTYLGDDGPREMRWYWKFLNAFFGIIVVSAGALVMGAVPVTMELDSTLREVRGTLDTITSDLEVLSGELRMMSGFLPDEEFRTVEEFRSREELSAFADELFSSGQTQELRDFAAALRDLHLTTLSPLLTTPSALLFVLLLLYFPLTLLMAAVISFGIRYGGPLRLFFLGVTVPALVTWILQRALSVSG